LLSEKEIGRRTTNTLYRSIEDASQNRDLTNSLFTGIFDTGKWLNFIKIENELSIIICKEMVQSKHTNRYYSIKRRKRCEH
jgi:hypothetical protein